jgi:hypothetical protein
MGKFALEIEQLRTPFRQPRVVNLPRWFSGLLVGTAFFLAPGQRLVAQNGSAPVVPPVASSARVVSGQSSYKPVTGTQRVAWLVESTLGTESLGAGLFTAAIGTARDHPVEYGSHWGGYADRYGMRFSGIATSNAMETSVGALWGEDPRYVRDAGKPVYSRIKNVVAMTFVADRRDGHRAPAYARYMAISGSNFLSNTWRADSEATNRGAALRTVWGVVGRMGSNAVAEFWPDIKTRLHSRR